MIITITLINYSIRFNKISISLPLEWIHSLIIPSGAWFIHYLWPTQ